MRERFSDRGSATVWTVGVIGVLCVVFGVVLALGQVVVVRHRAAGGADLAALAAADHWTEGAAAACARAERVARAQGTRLERCAVTGEISDVTATAGRGPFTARARARAGPAGQEPTTVRPQAHTGKVPTAAAPDPVPTAPHPAPAAAHPPFRAALPRPSPAPPTAVMPWSSPAPPPPATTP